MKFYQSVLDDKIQNISDTHYKLAQLENIKNNNKDYQKIERLAEQKANDIFSNKKAILAAAIISVFIALRKDPKKQLLIYNSYYPSNGVTDFSNYILSIMSTQHPENHLQFNQRKLLEIVEQFYDRLLKVAANDAIHTLSVTNSDQCH